MVNTVPQVGRIAIVQLDSATMAYAQGYTVNESVSVIKEYVLEPSGTPSTGWPQYLQLDRSRDQSTSIIYTSIIQLKRCLKRWRQSQLSVVQLAAAAETQKTHTRALFRRYLLR